METSYNRPRLIGRLYFLVLLPFLAAVIGPWISMAVLDRTHMIFILWSACIGLFYCGAKFFWAINSTHKVAPVVAYIAIFLAMFCVVAICLFFFLYQPLWSIIVLSVIYISLLKLSAVFWFLEEDQQASKQLHRRALWAVLTCHMLLGLNTVYAFSL